jgi:trimeric autotransporter adhesin
VKHFWERQSGFCALDVYVESGGFVSGTTVNGRSGDHQQRLASVVTFSSGGELLRDASASSNGTISGFTGDSLDVAGFGSGTALAFTEALGGASGTLTLTRTQTASILLVGQYMASQFSLATDGQGGTVVTDTIVTISQAAIIAPVNS